MVINDIIYFVAIVPIVGALLFGLCCMMFYSEPKVYRYEAVLVFPSNFDKSRPINQRGNDWVSNYTVDKKFNVEFPHKPKRGDVFKIDNTTYMYWDTLIRYRDIEGHPERIDYPIVFRYVEKPVTVASEIN